MQTGDPFPASHGVQQPAGIAHLESLDCFLEQSLGDVFPCSLLAHNPARFTVLDVACRSGAWALAVAAHCPAASVVGIDHTPEAIAYARSQAAHRNVQNVTFAIMDARAALHFPDHYFDAVHARLLLQILQVEQWPAYLRECMRVTRPGGVICLTEYERGSSSSPALEKLTALATFALRLGGYSPSPDGATIGLTTRLPRLLRETGCQQVQVSSHVVEYSRGTPLYKPMSDLIAAAWPLLKPSLLELGLLLSEQAESLYQQVQREIAAEDFCGSWPFLTAWGTKAL